MIWTKENRKVNRPPAAVTMGPIGRAVAGAGDGWGAWGQATSACLLGEGMVIGLADRWGGPRRSPGRRIPYPLHGPGTPARWDAGRRPR